MTTMDRRAFLKAAGVAGSALLGWPGLLPRLARAQGTLRALTWPGYDEPGVIGPFEQRHRVTVQSRIYNDSGVALSLLQQSAPGEWDVAIIDTAYIERAARAGLLEPLPEDLVDWDSFLSVYQRFPEGYVDGRLYSVPTKFGYFGVVYNTRQLGASAVESYEVLFDPALKGRIIQYAWYLPNIATIGMYLGLPDPFNIKGKDLEEVKKVLLRLKPQVASIGWEQETQQALANGSAWLAFPAGEFIYGNLVADGHPVEFTIPREGGARWTESAAVIRRTRQPKLAYEWVRYFASPDGQARIAMAEAYRGLPPNAAAAELLTPEQRQQIKWDEVETFVQRTRLTRVPENNDEWLEVWEEYLAA